MTSIRSYPLQRMLVLLAALLGFSAPAQLSFIYTNNAPSAIPRRTSMVFIQADGVGYGDLSCYGQTKFQTPNLDKLAAEGIRFTNYFASATAPTSHAALLFGKNPGGEITVAQILKNSGYHTGLIGEWDLGDENSSGAPWKKGFDEFAGYFDPNDAENYYADYIFRFAPKSLLNETNNRLEDFIGREMIYANTGGKKGQYIPDLYTKAVLNFVKINQPDAFNRHRPFFLMVNYKISGKAGSVLTDAPYSDEAWPQPEKNKAAMIARLDGDIGKLLEQLNTIGMTNNVIIFFSSDTTVKKTAEIDPDFFHSNISTNDLRVPMIARWPGKIPAGQVSGLKWSARDFLPTAAEIAFTRSPEKIDGVSILPTLSGQTQINRPKSLEK